MATSSLAPDEGLAARLASAETAVPEPLRAVLRGVGQVFFQGSALSGACFVAGIAANSPLMAVGGLAGSAIGLAVARLAKFDPDEIADGIYGFNPALVGVASFFFFKPGAAAVLLMVVGCVAATFVTRLMRKGLPFPTYTTPFIVTTWLLWLVGPSLGAQSVAPGEAPSVVNAFAAAANGVGQVMFQANMLTALLFVLGIALGDWRHAVLVVVGSALGVLAANYHVTPEQRALDPERMAQRFLPENIGLGLYSYNATLAAVALFLSRRSLARALLGVLLSVPLTELVPKLGLPALTAPFVLATWLVLILAWFDATFLNRAPTTATPSHDAAG